MSVEPEKFFIGLMEFFSILLPGALLNYIVMGQLGPVVLGSDKFQKLTGGEGLAAFLVVSYLFGHLIFLLGSWLDESYNWAQHYNVEYADDALGKGGRSGCPHRKSGLRP